MKEQLIEFETAKLADSKGSGKVHWSNDESFIRSEKEYKRPTQSLLQKWLREVYNIDIFVLGTSNAIDGVINNYYCEYFIGIKSFETDSSKTYEEALEVGLQEALKLI